MAMTNNHMQWIRFSFFFICLLIPFSVQPVDTILYQGGVPDRTLKPNPQAYYFCIGLSSVSDREYCQHLIDSKCNNIDEAWNDYWVTPYQDGSSPSPGYSKANGVFDCVTFSAFLEYAPPPCVDKDNAKQCECWVCAGATGVENEFDCLENRVNLVSCSGGSTTTTTTTPTTATSTTEPTTATPTTEPTTATPTTQPTTATPTTQPTTATPTTQPTTATTTTQPTTATTTTQPTTETTTTQPTTETTTTQPTTTTTEQTTTSAQHPATTTTTTQPPATTAQPPATTTQPTPTTTAKPPSSTTTGESMSSSQSHGTYSTATAIVAAGGASVAVASAACCLNSGRLKSAPNVDPNAPTAAVPTNFVANFAGCVDEVDEMINPDDVLVQTVTGETRKVSISLFKSQVTHVGSDPPDVSRVPESQSDEDEDGPKITVPDIM